MISFSFVLLSIFVLRWLMTCRQVLPYPLRIFAASGVVERICKIHAARCWTSPLLVIAWWQTVVVMWLSFVVKKRTTAKRKRRSIRGEGFDTFIIRFILCDRVTRLLFNAPLSLSSFRLLDCFSSIANTTTSGWTDTTQKLHSFPPLSEHDGLRYYFSEEWLRSWSKFLFSLERNAFRKNDKANESEVRTLLLCVFYGNSRDDEVRCVQRQDFRNLGTYQVACRTSTVDHVRSFLDYDSV